MRVNRCFRHFVVAAALVAATPALAQRGELRPGEREVFRGGAGSMNGAIIGTRRGRDEGRDEIRDYRGRVTARGERGTGDQRIYRDPLGRELYRVKRER